MWVFLGSLATACEPEFVYICHSRCMANGVFKTTRRGRGWGWGQEWKSMKLFEEYLVSIPRWIEHHLVG